MIQVTFLPRKHFVRPLSANVKAKSIVEYFDDSIDFDSIKLRADALNWEIVAVDSDWKPMSEY